MTSQHSFQPAFDRATEVADRLQGEVLAAADLCVVIADLGWPMDERSSELASDTSRRGLMVVPHPVDRVVLLTQTCDLQRTGPDAYLCQVCPLVEGVDPDFANEVARGRRPGWVWVPWYSVASVADLSRITTVERSVIVGAAACGRPRTSTERLRFAESVSRHLTRTAFPETISRVLAPILRRMRERHDRRSPEGQCISRIASLRLEADPDLDANLPDLTVLVVLESQDLPSLPPGNDMRDQAIDTLKAQGNDACARAVVESVDALARREAWQALAELWLQPASDLVHATDSGIGSVDVEVLSGEDLSFERSRNAPELDLAYLTSRAA